MYRHLQMVWFTLQRKGDISYICRYARSLRRNDASAHQLSLRASARVPITCIARYASCSTYLTRICAGPDICMHVCMRARVCLHTYIHVQSQLHRQLSSAKDPLSDAGGPRFEFQTGRVTGKSIPSLWRDKHFAIEGLRPPGHHAGHSIQTKKDSSESQHEQQNLRTCAVVRLHAHT